MRLDVTKEQSHLSRPFVQFLTLIGRDAAWVKEVLASYKLSSVNEVFIMTADKNGKCLVIKKEGAA